MIQSRSQLPPYVLSIIGLALICAAGLFAFTGRAWVRFHGWVYRANDPKSFWWEVALYFFCGIGLITYFVYLVT
jgi:hypothetical protein